MGDKDKKKITDLIDTAEKVMDAVKNNEETIEKFVGGDDKQDLTDQTPLREVHKTDEKVLVVLEHKGDVTESAGVTYNNGTLVMEVGEMEYVAEVPEDIQLGTLETNYNNGVFELEVKRGEM